jgi:DNA-binding XRE family transcriptional regulator
MIASITQIKMARAGLGLSQGDLASRVGISTAAFNAIETGGSDPKTSTMTAIVTALEKAGVVFEPSGAVSIAPKADKFIVEPGQNPDAATRRAALQIINADRRARNLPEVSDD